MPEYLKEILLTVLLLSPIPIGEIIAVLMYDLLRPRHKKGRATVMR